MLALVQKCQSALIAIAMVAGVTAFPSNHSKANDQAPLRVGAVTRHAERFVGQHILLRGYLLARSTGYILFSDEARGRISRYDLPVAGAGIDQMTPAKSYLIEGEFLRRGVAASNGSKYELDLSAPPRLAQP